MIPRRDFRHTVLYNQSYPSCREKEIQRNNIREMDSFIRWLSKIKKGILPQPKASEELCPVDCFIGEETFSKEVPNTGPAWRMALIQRIDWLNKPWNQITVADVAREFLWVLQQEENIRLWHLRRQRRMRRLRSLC